MWGIRFCTENRCVIALEDTDWSTNTYQWFYEQRNCKRKKMWHKIDTKVKIVPQCFSQHMSTHYSEGERPLCQVYVMLFNLICILSVNQTYQTNCILVSPSYLHLNQATFNSFWIISVILMSVLFTEENCSNKIKLAVFFQWFSQLSEIILLLLIEMMKKNCKNSYTKPEVFEGIKKNMK